MYMSIGIIAVAVNSMLSHFFSGTGRHYFNTIGSAIGFVITLSTGLILIPHYGIKGAAFTATLSYSFSLIFQMIVFRIITKTKLSEYIPDRSDFIFFRNELKKIINNKKL